METIFKPIFWMVEETEDKELLIHCSGRDIDNRSVYAIIKGFQPYVYLELPLKISWNLTKCKALFDYTRDRLKSQAPLSFNMTKRDNLYGRRPMYCMQIFFSCHDHMRKFANMCEKSSLYIPGIGNFGPGDFKVHEQNVDTIIKFATVQDIDLADWISCIEESLNEDDYNSESSDETTARDNMSKDSKFATSDTCIIVDHDNVKRAILEKKLFTKPLYCSFDIECYSENHNAKDPEPLNPANKVFQISMIFGYLGEPKNTRDSILLTLFDPIDTGRLFNEKPAIIIRCKTETDLLLKFSEVMRERDPDIILGYNILKFDWGYMISRSEILGIYTRFILLSRIIDKRSFLGEINWSSSAYGKQEYRFLIPYGRTNVDLMLEIERNYRLTSYSLNNVSKEFLGDSKDDINYKQLFLLYRLSDETLPLFDTDATIEDIKNRIAIILTRDNSKGEVKTLRKELLAAKSRIQLHTLVRKAITIVGEYCIQDSQLPIDLCEKLNLWTTMEEFSNNMSIPASYIHTRGQGIRTLAQLYRYTVKEKIIIPYRTQSDKDDIMNEKYVGATVQDAISGDYDNVITLDFQSLYPTIMMARNICHTTLVRDDDPIDDSLCHVIEFEDHRGCIHDTHKRKTKLKAEDVLCRNNRFRFRRVEIIITENPDLSENVEYRYEGLEPRLVKGLLVGRKIVKKEMERLQHILDMHLGKASVEDIEDFKKWGIKIIEKGSLDSKTAKETKATIEVLNAKQLAQKVSANSAYGGLGSRMGAFPLIQGAASVTAVGRIMIKMAIDKILTTFKNTSLVYGDTDSCMIELKNSSLAEVFSCGEACSKVVTHMLKCYILNIPEDYPLYNKNGEQVGIIGQIRSGTDAYRGVLKGDNNKDTDDKQLYVSVGLDIKSKIKVLEYESNPIFLDFENVYGRFFLLTMKRYMAQSINRAGKIYKTTNKGVCSVRREGCTFLRSNYAKIGSSILNKASTADVMNQMYDIINRLYTRQVPVSDLVLLTKLTDIMNDAKKRERVVNGTSKSFYIDADGNEFEPFGPTDPRLVFTNRPAVVAGLKMLNRGQTIPKNTKLELVYIETENWSHLGDKAEEYTFFKDNSRATGMRIDYEHYLEKQLSKPFTEILKVLYPKVIVPYEKIEDSLSRCINDMDVLKMSRIKNSRIFVKDIIRWDIIETDENESGTVTLFQTLIGWDAIKEIVHFQYPTYKIPEPWTLLGVDSKQYKRFNISIVPEKRTYTFKAIRAKIEYILVMDPKHRDNIINQRQLRMVDQISVDRYPDLVNTCKRMTSKLILDDIYRRFGNRIRAGKRPGRSGIVLKANTNIVMLSDGIDYNGKEYKKGSIGSIKNTIEIDRGVRTQILYDILLEDRYNTVLLNGIARKEFNTYTIKDSTIMTDILKARQGYREIVKQLDTYFCPISI